MINVVINSGIEVQNKGNKNSVITIYDKTYNKGLLKEAPFIDKVNLPHTYYMDLYFLIDDKEKETRKVYSLPKLENVHIQVHSTALGDQIAWIPICEEFRKKHDCKVIVSCKFPELFQPFYPDLEFKRQWFEGETITKSEVIKSQYTYVLGYSVSGWMNEGDDKLMSPIDCRRVPLQDLACYQLGIEPQEVKPSFKSNIKEPIIKDKYVAITTTGTAQFKIWNNPDGWQEMINYFISKGYRVIDLGDNSDHLDGAEDYTGKLEWNKLMNILQHAELFICASNGLQWLAWACGTQVVTLSNITEDGTEFDHIKVTNTDVCHGCWNDPEFVYDNNDVKYCPRNKDFECTKSITSQMVIDKIEENELL